LDQTCVDKALFGLPYMNMPRGFGTAFCASLVLRKANLIGNAFV
jgi:hypothetical protein